MRQRGAVGLGIFEQANQIHASWIGRGPKLKQRVQPREFGQQFAMGC